MKSIPLQKGFYVSPRNIEVNEVFGNKNDMALWLYLKSQAGYALGHYRDGAKAVLLKEGELVMSQRTLSKICGMAQETIKKSLIRLRDKGLLTFRAIYSGTVVSLAKRVLNAALRTPARDRDHKEIKDITRSINIKKDLYPKPTVQGVKNWVMGVEETQNYLKKLDSEKKAQFIPECAKNFLKSFLVK